MVIMGPRDKNKPTAKNKPSTHEKPGFGGATAPIFSHVPGGAPGQSPHTSSREDSPPPAKVAFRGVSTPASTPSSPSSRGSQPGDAVLLGTRQPAEDLAGLKTVEPSTKSSSSRARSTLLGSKRRMKT